MDLEDLFDVMQRRKKPYRKGEDRYREDDRYRGEDRYREDDRYHGRGLPPWFRLLANPKVILLFVVLGLVLLAVAAFVLLPLLGQLIDQVDSTGGLKGLIDRIWQGSGGGGRASP